MLLCISKYMGGGNEGLRSLMYYTQIINGHEIKNSYENSNTNKHNANLKHIKLLSFIAIQNCDTFDKNHMIHIIKEIYNAINSLETK